MPYDYVKKQTENALSAINRPRPYRPLKVVPHNPTKTRTWSPMRQDQTRPSL
jgi:hypothetical protein